jgi:excinuclease ABC subunit B
VNGSVILYADRETDAIRHTVAETNRRREIQGKFNREHGITPETVVKRISSLRDSIWEADYVTVPKETERPEPQIPTHELPALLEGLRREMAEAAQDLEFERAAALRDRIRALEAERLRTA